MRYYIELNDKRNLLLSGLLRQNGADVLEFTAAAAENMQTGDVCVFSPAKKLTPASVMNLKEGTVLFAGNFDKTSTATGDSLIGEKKAEGCQAADILRQKNIRHVNFLADEVFAHKNAALTAEGVLSLLIQNTQKSIYQSNILILGAGRCAKAAARLFDKLGLNFALVTYSEGKLGESCLFAEKTFFKDEFLNDSQKFDVIINTIPSKIFDREKAKKISKNTLVIEVASLPCLDANDAGKNGFVYLPAPGLPQLFCCESAARLMLEAIEKNL